MVRTYCARASAQSRPMRALRHEAWPSRTSPLIRAPRGRKGGRFAAPMRPLPPPGSRRECARRELFCVAE